MLCERCGIREANIQYTEVINGEKTEHHFCAQCAKEMDSGPYSAIFDGEFPLGKLLSGLLGIEETDQVPDKLHQVACPTCKTGYDDFIKNSQFGCADCYIVFGPLMEESLKQLQGSTSHTGKYPKYQKILCRTSKIEGTESESSEEGGEELLELEAKLKEALRLEDYETAAVCRDKMKDLRKGHEADA